MRLRRMPGVRMAPEEPMQILRRIAQGDSHAVVLAMLACSTKGVQRLLKTSGELTVRARMRSPLRLAIREREQIGHE